MRRTSDATGSFECMGELVGENANQRSGATGAVRLVTPRRKGVIVPAQALVPTGEGFVVFVVDGDEVRSRPVRLGPRLPGGVELLDGVAWDERIVVDGAADLQDHAPVEVVGVSAPAP